MELIDKNKNDKFSSLRGLDLQELIYQIDCFDLSYRKNLNLPKKLTFGTEIEYENYDKRFVDKYINENLMNWYSGYDGSLFSGGEIISPILTDTRKTWKELRDICTFLKDNKARNECSGAHIHVGSHILNGKIGNWINFIKLYIAYESIMFRFFYGDKINARVNLCKYASPIADVLYNHLEDLKNQENLSDFEEILNFRSRYYAINFSNVKFNNSFNEIKEKNTIELRCPNGTIEEVIWQNNINTFAKLILKAKSENLDEEFLDYKLKDGVIKPYEQFYIYNEIRLK